jgi:uncharacterized protein (TIGR02246 family)
MSGLDSPEPPDRARRLVLFSAGGLAAAGCAAPARRGTKAELVEQVRAAETAFARTMADRDLDAFIGFVSADAVFVSGARPLVGRDAIRQAWSRFFEGSQAPFSWKPEIVVVVDSGDLAQSIGPVASPSGQVASRFNSTWRLEADGRWRVVFDHGYRLCEGS